MAQFQVPEYVHIIEAASPTLESLSLYFEDHPPPTSLRDGLARARRLKSLELIDNPPLHVFRQVHQHRPLFQVDDVLSSLTLLEKLKVTATNVSTRFFCSTSLSIQEVELVCLNDHVQLDRSALVSDLSDLGNVPNLKRLSISDVAILWSEQELKSVNVECLRRRVKFEFIAEVLDRPVTRSRKRRRKSRARGGAEHAVGQGGRAT
ncbi:hypothetical protein ACM66B_005737 [Microbotryomycetes sp. NB124-2]